jgi:predicted  nucleic acid-binding Zn-ribbon protein
MNETEKVAVANDIISGLEKELLKQDDRIKNLSLDNEKKSLRIMQLESKIEVYQDVVDALIKELRGDR